jgi:NTE family protein
MTTNLITFLKNHKVFQSLDESVLATILKESKTISLEKDKLLFNQGDPSDGIYIVISGKLTAILITKDSVSTVGLINAVEIIGELGVLSDKPRSLTIQSVENSELLFIPSDIFKDLFLTHASVCVATSLPLIDRSIKTIKFAKKKKPAKHIIFLPADTNLALSSFYENFQKEIPAVNQTLVLTEDTFQKENRDGNFDEMMDVLEQDNDTIIYLLKSCESKLANFACNRVSTAYLIINHDVNLEYYKSIVRKVREYKHGTTLRLELILLRDSRNAKISTSFDLSTFSIYHKIKLDNKNDYKRLARFIMGKAVGVVLSGGGTKGWAHIGAIKALLDANIPIDAIGGTSVGAIIAALYAMSLSYEEAICKFHEFVHESRSTLKLRHVTLPIISLFDGKNITDALAKLFDSGVLIEDLKIPFFCTSCNLATNQANVHTEGNLFNKIRASISIPGLIPPVVLNGQIHVDGSVLSHIPVSNMKDFLGNTASTTIAVLVSMPKNDPNQYDFPPSFTLKQGIMHKLKLDKKKYKFPAFFADAFMRTVTFGGAYYSYQSTLLADILIEPNLDQFGLLEVNTEKEEQMIAIGYKETQEKLKKYEAMLKSK